MRRIDAFRAIAPTIAAEDLVTTSIGATWDDWWNLKPADNTFFTGVLGSVTSTALGLAVSLPHRRIVAFRERRIGADEHRHPVHAGRPSVRRT